jgi:3-keto-disaccharide hydrolase
MTMAMTTGLAIAETVNFDDMKPGAAPAGWTATQTGSGTAKWAIEKDESAPSKPNVLKQSGQATFPVCIKNDTNLKDGFVEVKFKPVSGKEDQAGGVIWRTRDANNYYIFRANAAENNAVLYKTVNGKRTPLDIVGRKGGYGVKETVASGQWHTLRVEFAGNRFKAYFDGKHLFDVEDATFTGAGKVGVWTKADSVTLFDDFRYAAK